LRDLAQRVLYNRPLRTDGAFSETTLSRLSDSLFHNYIGLTTAFRSDPKNWVSVSLLS